MSYNYLIVGAGFFGATIAERLANAGKSVLIIDRRPHLAGNAYSYTDQSTGIEIHQYGSHIFHTEDDEVWHYITKFTDFNNYVHTVLTRHHGKLYPMPINLDTINLFYGKHFTSKSAEGFIAQITKQDVLKYQIKNPKNLEEKGISLIGEKLYHAFIKNYTEKQWGTSAKNLSPELLKRIPVRFSHDHRYFASAKYQGIPKNGYTQIVEKMLDSPLIEVRLNTDFKDLALSSPQLQPRNPQTHNSSRSQLSALSSSQPCPIFSTDFKIVYTGPVDELLDYELGVLPYRSLRFETRWSKTEDTGCAVINEADAKIPYTRTHNYKYYQIHQQTVMSSQKTYLCQEYPAPYAPGEEPYYPVNNKASASLYQKYLKLLHDRYPNLTLGGRLGAYQYWDMDVAIKNALTLAKTL